MATNALFYHDFAERSDPMDELTMGARIARRRKEKNMTQEALAQILGVSNQAVSK